MHFISNVFLCFQIDKIFKDEATEEKGERARMVSFILLPNIEHHVGKTSSLVALPCYILPCFNCLVGLAYMKFKKLKNTFQSCGLKNVICRGKLN